MRPTLKNDYIYQAFISHPKFTLVLTLFLADELWKEYEGLPHKIFLQKVSSSIDCNFWSDVVIMTTKIHTSTTSKRKPYAKKVLLLFSSKIDKWASTGPMTFSSGLSVWTATTSFCIQLVSPGSCQSQEIKLLIKVFCISINALHQVSYLFSAPRLS